MQRQLNSIINTMEPSTRKPRILRNIVVRLFLFCVFMLGVRFAYVVIIRGESCDLGDFYFFSLPNNLNSIVSGAMSLSSSSSAIIAVGKSAPAKPHNLPDLWATKGFQKAAQFYSCVFQDLISNGFFTPNSRALCLETPTGADVFALKEMGFSDSIGIFKKASKPLVISGQAIKQPFGDGNFDFVFSGAGMIEKSAKPAGFCGGNFQDT